VLAASHVKVFSEFGYRYVTENIFYKNWQVDLKGDYFSFGVGLNL
jgi:hypothetical protein